MTLLAALAAGWVALVLAAPWLPTPAASVVYLFAAHVCHQIAERSWHLDGAQLPVCARCLGIYAGAAIALMLPGPQRIARVALRHPAYVRIRRYVGRVPRSGPAVMVGAILVNAATIAIEWTTVWPVSNALRTAAGATLGIALAWAIGTVDYGRWPSARRITSALPRSPI